MTYQEVYLMDDLTIEAKAIYGMLCSYVGNGSTAYPSVEFMCDKLHITKGRFYRHMKLLIDAGVVEKEQKKRKGVYAPNVYTLIPNAKYADKPNIENGYTDTLQMDSENAEHKDDKINNLKINNFNNNSKRGSVRFTPPTLEEVKDYCKERCNNVDPERFIDFYSSKGWMIGKNKMKDWKAAVRTWERRDNNSSATQENQQPKIPREKPSYYKYLTGRPPRPDDPFQ